MRYREGEFGRNLSEVYISGSLGAKINGSKLDFCILWYAARKFYGWKKGVSQLWCLEFLIDFARMSTYTATIGMEVHAELKTRTKMFCTSKNDGEETRPNVNVCPVCLAHPGTLPVINREAVRHVLRVGLALGSRLADYTEFDRKNYFYPDLPKGYQISQFEFPLVSGGALNDVAITRVHLEEDTASSIHDEKTGETLVDYNRSGVPLMELVTEPVIHSAKQAGDFGRSLQLLLRYLGASDANMERGQMRVEANISVSRDGNLGTKVEVKNLNSFRSMERAVEYEIKRQTALLESGGTVIQETRGWNDAKQETFVQRIKEGSADYRYFPDPDLPSLRLSEIAGLDSVTLLASLPELPVQRTRRYTAHGLKLEDALQFTTNTSLGDFFDKVAGMFSGDSERIKVAANYIANDLANSVSRDMQTRDTEIQAEIRVSPINFAKLVVLISEGKLSSRGAKDVLAQLVLTDVDPEVIAKEQGLFQNSSEDSLLPAIQSVIKSNEKVVADYRSGKQAALMFLVGQGMKITKGSGNPEVIKQILLKELG